MISASSINVKRVAHPLGDSSKIVGNSVDIVSVLMVFLHLLKVLSIVHNKRSSETKESVSKGPDRMSNIGSMI